MNAYISLRKMEPKAQNLEDKRESLVDYIVSQEPKVVEHLEYIVRYLRGEIPFVELREHAMKLPSLEIRGISNVGEIAHRLDGTELPVVEDYFKRIVSPYLKGESGFEYVDKALDGIIDLKPMPDPERTRPDPYFFKGRPGRRLADAIEEV